MNNIHKRLFLFAFLLPLILAWNITVQAQC